MSPNTPLAQKKFLEQAGPPWTSQEIASFHRGFRSLGRNFVRLSRLLPRRTETEVEGFFKAFRSDIRADDPSADALIAAAARAYGDDVKEQREEDMSAEAIATMERALASSELLSPSRRPGSARRSAPSSSGRKRAAESAASTVDPRSRTSRRLFLEPPARQSAPASYDLLQPVAYTGAASADTARTAAGSGVAHAVYGAPGAGMPVFVPGAVPSPYVSIAVPSTSYVPAAAPLQAAVLPSTAHGDHIAHANDSTQQQQQQQQQQHMGILVPCLPTSTIPVRTPGAADEHTAGTARAPPGEQAKPAPVAFTILPRVARRKQQVHRGVPADDCAFLSLDGLQRVCGLNEAAPLVVERTPMSSPGASPRGALADSALRPWREVTLAHAVRHAVGPKVRHWMLYEWFYSTLDLPYFAYPDFMHCLKVLRLDGAVRLTRAEWARIRARLGRPRRFSAHFLAQERQRLAQYRSDTRRRQRGQPPLHCRAEDMVWSEPQELSVGHCVLARHPHTGLIHTAHVISTRRDTCRLRFERTDLGVVDVRDVDIMILTYPEGASATALDTGAPQPAPSESPPPPQPQPRDDNGTLPMSPPDNAVGSAVRGDAHTDIPHPLAVDGKLIALESKHVADMLRLLDMKYVTLKRLREMNAAAYQHVSKRSDPYEEEFQNEYAWLVLVLASIDRHLDRKAETVYQGVKAAEKIPSQANRPESVSFQQDILDLVLRQSDTVLQRAADSLSIDLRSASDGTKHHASQAIALVVLTVFMIRRSHIAEQEMPAVVDELLTRLRPGAGASQAALHDFNAIVSILQRMLTA